MSGSSARGLGAGWAWRNHPPRRWKRVLLPLFYLMAAAIVLGANPFRGQVITPVDILASQRAWAFVDPGVKVRNYHRSDTLNWLLPGWTVARHQLRQGEFPLWNDKVAGGGSFLTVSSTLFTPAFAIFAITPNPAMGFYLAILVNLTIAGLGMHLFLRRRLGVIAALAGATSFQFCGFNAAWLYWPHVFTLIWAPWLLWSIDRCCGKPGVRRAFWLAAFTALVCLGGFPFLSVLLLEAGALYALFLWFSRLKARRRHWPFAGWYVAGTILGLVIAAIPLFGLVHWLHQFDIGYRYGRGSYLDIHAWKQLFPPWTWDTRHVEKTMYVGVVMLAFASSAIVATMVRWRRAGALRWFIVALLLITVALVFGLWPMWLIGWLPGMAYNSWSRAIGIMDMALIVLGAMAIDGCLRRARSWRWRRTAYVAVTLLVIIQVVEVGVLFRAWNGPVPERDYYPRVPTIAYMQDRAGPFDYVITDRSFLMSGTLGTYGLREWLAHYFRSPELQRALHRMAAHPFNTHVASASRFPAGDIQYDSDAMAAYNVRFAAIDARHDPVSKSPVTPVRPGKHVALPSMPEHTYTQWFTVHDPIRMDGLAVRFATYLKAALPGTVTLTLVDASGAVRSTSSVHARDVVDNTYLFFGFPKPVVLAPGRHGFSLDYARPPGSDARVTAWSFATPTAGARLLANGAPRDGNIDFRLHRASTGAFRRVFASAGTAVLESTHYPGGPYFLQSVADQPDSRSARNVRVESYRPAKFVLRYTGKSAGFVVVPMTGNSDWHAYVDGKRVDYPLKGGVMPAVAVAGPSTIAFDYQPPASRFWIPWLVVLSAGIAAMLWIGRRNTSRRRA